MNILVNRVEHDEITKAAKKHPAGCDCAMCARQRKETVEKYRQDLVPKEGQPGKGAARVEDVRAAARNKYLKPGNLKVVERVVKKSAFGVEKADRRQQGAAAVGAGATTAAVGEYASGNYNMRHGGHSGLKNLGTENVKEHRAYVKSPEDPHWHSHNLNLGRAEGAVVEEKRVLRHLTRGVATSNAARLAGYGTAAVGAGMVAAGSRRRKVKKAHSNEDLSPAALQGAGGTAAVGGLGLRQLYTHKANVEGKRAAAADRLHAKTATMTRMSDAAKQRRYGFHEGRARQARHFEDVFRGSAKTGAGIAGAGAAMLAAGAYGQHMQNVGGRKSVTKSAFGVAAKEAGKLVSGAKTGVRLAGRGHSPLGQIGSGVAGRPTYEVRPGTALSRRIGVHAGVAAGNAPLIAGAAGVGAVGHRQLNKSAFGINL